MFLDEDLGPCLVATNVPEDILASMGVDLRRVHTKTAPMPGFKEIITRLRSAGLIDNANTRGFHEVYFWVTVPSVWTRGKTLTIRFQCVTDSDRPGTYPVTFEGYDLETREVYREEFSVSGSMRVIHGYGSKDLKVTVPLTSVGVKRGVARVGAAVFYKDFGYNFVQTFGSSDLPTPPPADVMSQASNNSDYYWEGLRSIDGFGIPDQYALFHSDDWNIRWAAANLLDDYRVPYVSGAAVIMTYCVDHKMIRSGTPAYRTECSMSDLRIISEGWEGMCDEISNMEISLLRSMGIPARQMFGTDVRASSHAWCEIWSVVNQWWENCLLWHENAQQYSRVDAWRVWELEYQNPYTSWDWDPDDPQKFDWFWNMWEQHDGSELTWIHADPTLHLWNQTAYYRVNFGYRFFQIWSCLDDKLNDPSVSAYDKDPTDGLLLPYHYNSLYPKYGGDVKYTIDYAGPNQY